MFSEKSMTNKSSWTGQTSPFLYLYHYLGSFFLAFVASRYIDNVAFAVATGVSIYLVFRARSMKYSLSGDKIHFSPSLEDKEALTVDLKDVVEICVVDRMPWGMLKLGTVILIVDETEEAHPCIKCVPFPHALAMKIKRVAQEAGAGEINIEIIK